MANLKISQLTDGGAAQSTDEIPIARGGANFRLNAGRFSSTNRIVTSQTSNYSVLSSDSGVFFTNTGASAEVDFTLPSAVSGLQYIFYVDPPHTLKVIAAGGAVIRYLSTLSAINGSISSTATGNKLSLLCIGVSSADSLSEWVVDTLEGAWSIT